MSSVPEDPGIPKAAATASKGEVKSPRRARTTRESAEKILIGLRESVVATATETRTAYLAFLSAGLYLAVTVGATTHEQLLGRGGVQLPLLNIDLPIRGFYFVAPLLFLVLHFNLLLQLRLLASKMHRLNGEVDKLPEGRQSAEWALLSSSFFVQVVAGRQESRLLHRLLRLTVWLTAVWAPVLILLEILFLFLPYHSWIMTFLWHYVLVVVSLLLLWFLWPGYLWRTRLKQRTLKELWWRFRQFWQRQRWAGCYRVLRRRRWTWGGLGALNLVTLACLVMAALPLNPFPRDLRLHEAGLVDEALAKGGPRLDLRGRDLRGAELTGADLRRADLRALPHTDASGSKQEEQLCALEGTGYSVAHLEGANLSYTHLDDALLNGARLHGANLRSAYLMNAVLSSAQLVGADLRDAHLEAADLSSACLVGADLRGANLQGALLTGARLLGADLRGANLEGAELIRADLRGAAIAGASFAAADLRGVSIWMADLISIGRRPPSLLAHADLRHFQSPLLAEEEMKELEYLVRAAVEDEKALERFTERLRQPLESIDRLVEWHVGLRSELLKSTPLVGGENPSISSFECGLAAHLESLIDKDDKGAITNRIGRRILRLQNDRESKEYYDSGEITELIVSDNDDAWSYIFLVAAALVRNKAHAAHLDRGMVWELHALADKANNYCKDNNHLDE